MPFVLNNNAEKPTATLSPPVVLLLRAVCPTAVLSRPVVLCWSASKPIPVLPGPLMVRLPAITPAKKLAEPNVCKSVLGAGEDDSGAGRCCRQGQISGERDAPCGKISAAVAFHDSIRNVRIRGRVVQCYCAGGGGGGDVRVACERSHSGVIQRRGTAQRDRAAATESGARSDGEGTVGELAVVHGAAQLPGGKRARKIARAVGEDRVRRRQ